jgi:poly(A) polymerase
MSIREVRRALYRHGIGPFKDWARLRWAEDPKPSNAVQWRALGALADSWQRPEFPVTGEQVMSAGVPQGPLVGRVLGEVEDWWIDSDFTDDPFSLAERLKAVVQATI